MLIWLPCMFAVCYSLFLCPVKAGILPVTLTAVSLAPRTVPGMQYMDSKDLMRILSKWIIIKCKYNYNDNQEVYWEPYNSCGPIDFRIIDSCQEPHGCTIDLTGLMPCQWCSLGVKGSISRAHSTWGFVKSEVFQGGDCLSGPFITAASPSQVSCRPGQAQRQPACLGVHGPLSWEGEGRAALYKAAEARAP